MAHLAHYREAHPTIFVVTHWINLVAMILLILHGLSSSTIRSLRSRRTWASARGLHVSSAASCCSSTCIVRVVLAFVVDVGADQRHASS
jgi:Ni/Fe-hydrogenase 1 B-type cytochrome subunit